MAKSYVDALAAKYFGQMTGGRRSSAASAPSYNPRNFVGAYQRTPGGNGTRPNSRSSNKEDVLSTLPENIQNPTNPYDWFLQKTLSQTNPWSNLVTAMSDPNQGIGKVVDILSQPMYANVAQATRQAENAYKGDIAGLLRDAANPFQFYSSGNEKKTPSDVLRGDADMLNSSMERLGSDVRVSGDTGVLAEKEGEGWQSRALKGIGGFAADVAGDPLSYIPGAVIAKGASVPGRLGMRGLRAAGQALPEGNIAGRLAGDIDTFAARLRGNRSPVPLDVGNAGGRRSVENTGFDQRVVSDATTPAAEISRAQEVPQATGTDLVPTGQVLQDVTEPNARIIPESEIADAPKPSIIDQMNEAWVPSGKKTRLMRNSETGEIRPYDAKIARGESAPKYPGLKITDLWTAVKPSEKQKAAQAMAKVQAETAPLLERITDKLSPQQTEMIAAAEKATRKPLDRKTFNQEWFRNLKDEYESAEPGASLEGITLSLRGVGEVTKPVYEWVQEIQAVRQGKKVAPETREALNNVAKDIADIQEEAWVARQAQEARPGDAGIVVRAAREQAKQAQAAAGRSASRRRLSGAALSSWMRRYAAILDPQELANLLASRSYKEFTTKRAGIGRKTVRQPSQWEDYYVDILKAPEVPEGAPVDNVYDAAKQGLRTASDTIEQAPPRLTVEQEAVVERIRRGGGLDEITLRALQETANDQLWRQIKPEGEFNLETNRGTRRNAETLGEGRGINRNGWNRKTQMNMWDRLVTQVSRTVPEGTVGYARSRFMRKELLPRLRAYEDFLELNAVHATASTGQVGMPLRLSQVLESFYLTKEGKNILDSRVFTGFSIGKDKPQGLVDVDALLHIGNIIADTVGDIVRNADDVDAAIRKAVNEWVKKADRKKIQAALEGVETYRAADGTTVTNVRQIGQGKMQEGVYTRQEVSRKDAKGVTDEVFSAVTDPVVVHALLQFAHDNAAAASIMVGRNVGSITEETIQSVLSILDDMTGAASYSDKVEALSDPGKVARRVRASYKRGVTNDQLDMAATKTQADLTEVVPQIDIDNAGFSRATSTIAKESAVGNGMPSNKMNVKTSEKYAANVESSFKELSAEAINPDDLADVAMQTGLFKMLDPLARTFAAHFGNATFHEALTKSGSVAGVYDRVYRHQLTTAENMARSLAKARGVDSKVVWKEAWDGIAKGDSIDSFPEAMREFATAARGVIEPFFAGPRNGETQSILSMFQREGFDIDHINFKMGNPRFKIPEDIRFEKPNTRKGAKPETVADVSQQWRQWQIDDPMDFMAKMQAIATELATETAIAKEFYRIGSSRGLVSTKPRAGFVAIDRGVKMNGKESVISRYLPVGDKGLVYMHKDVIPELRRMENLLQKADGRDTAFNNFVRNNFDPILSMWKSGMTIWRPGHHVRTLIGDLGMAFLVSGLKDPRYYLRSLKMVTRKQGEMQRTLRGNYGTWDAQKALQGFAERLDGQDFPTGNVGLRDELQQLGGVAGHMTGPAARVRIGNKRVDLDAETVHKNLMDRGVLPDFRKQEDIIDAQGSTGLVKSLTDKAQITGGRARTALGNFTEGRDDFVRIAHALHLLETKNYRNLDEAFDNVAATLRKAHPDGTDLTPFERNFMRRIFPFYSWTRKAIPLIIENLLLHPGRFNAYPKAMYNFAQSMGVDLESLSEPFPEDQLFPRFMTEKMTGIGFEADDGRYFSFDVGIPQADVMNEFFAGGPVGSIGGIAGMLNPAFKTPVELKTGTSLSTGAPINDTSDYIDSQIPGINAIASVTGTSPTGTLSNILSGRGTIDPQYQVQKGNRGGVLENPEYLINYLTGMRFTDASKPNYIRLAQIEQRDQIAAEIERNRELGWG